MANRIFSTGWEDYELLDAGGGKKLERWGKVITIRPETQAYFKSGNPFDQWNKLAHWEFVEGKNNPGKWKSLHPAEEQWKLKFKGLTFNVGLTSFKHLGLFPEQRINWDYFLENIQPDDRFLNLFAYTGAASCAARSKGADTYHVDSVKQAINWAARNMESSRLLNIRWVHDDALKFLKRLEKRTEQFDYILMDPPAWGSGVNKEKWKLEDKIDELMGTAARVLAPEGKLVLNTYSPQVDHKLLKELTSIYFPSVEMDVFELWMKTATGKELFFGNVVRTHAGQPT